MNPDILGHVGGFRGGGSTNQEFNEAYMINCPCGCREGWAAYTSPPIIVCSKCGRPAMEGDKA